LAGLVAGVLTIVVPPFVKRLGSPLYIGALFGSFVGDIFGAVLSVYFWVLLRRRYVARSIGFVLASAVAYMLAMFATIFSAEAIGSSQNVQGAPGTLGAAPVLACVLGGTVGGFVVLLAALLFFSSENRVSRNFSQAVKWCPSGGILGALGWAAGALLGGLIPFSPGNADTGYYYSIFLVWQTGMGLTIGWLFSREQVWAPASSALPPGVGSNRVARIVRISLFAGAALVLAFFARREFPGHYQSARWDRAYHNHLAETPSMGNLPEVQSVAPEQMLILNQFGEYVPGRTYSGKTRPPMDVKTLIPKAPVAQSYSVRYALPGAPTSGGNVGPHVDVQVQEYPNAAWAGYEIVEQGFGIELANPARPVKFGSRLYGQAKAGDNGQNGFYIWASENRLVILQFRSAEPDEVLKAYLERFPTSTTDRPLR
jgi:hypothetical protein